jgi:AcrR family transcriptional regulator
MLGRGAKAGPRPKTRERILDAAMDVFAEEGITPA